MQELSPADILGAYRKFSAIDVGPPKSGKTWNLATLFKLRPQPNMIWFHDFDQGVNSFLVAAQKYIPLAELDKRVKVFRYGVGSDRMSEKQQRKRYAQPAFDFIKNINRPYDFIDPKTGLYKEEAVRDRLAPDIVIVDSLTNFQEDLLDMVLNLNQHDLGDKGTDARTDYGQAMGKIVEAINTLKGLPCSFIFNAHEQILQDETTNVIRQQVMCYGKETLAQSITNHFDIVVYSFSDNGKYEWWIQPQKWIRSAGTRYREAKETRIEQDFSRIL